MMYNVRVFLLTWLGCIYLPHHRSYSTLVQYHFLNETKEIHMMDFFTNCFACQTNAYEPSILIRSSILLWVDFFLFCVFL
jgi:hypothetical protein